MDVMRKRLKTLESVPLLENAVYKAADSNEIDRISDLPDELVCHILSFLPTKDAIATSVLSTRYKDLFPRIPNPRLDLYDTLIENPTREASMHSIFNFSNFMDRLLNVKLRDVRSIRSLSLTFQLINDGRQIADWIGGFLPLNPKRLNLHVSSYLMRPNCLAEKLYGCRIKSIVLCLEATSYVPEHTFSMPNLKKLYVIMTRFAIVNALIKGSPLLERLEITNCSGEAQENLCIKAPFLQSLRILNALPNFTGALELDAPNLTKFAYRGFLDWNYLLKRLTSLNLAQLEVYPNSMQLPSEAQEQAIEVLKACCDARILWFSELIATAVVHYLPTLPQFPNLVIVGMTKMDVFGWALLTKLLTYAPRFRALCVKEGIHSSFCGRTVCLNNSIVVRISRCDYGLFILNVRRIAAAGLAMASTTAAHE